MSFAAQFVAGLKRLDAERLQQSAKAAIQSNGRLSLTVEAGRLMHLADDKSIIIFGENESSNGIQVSVRVVNDKMTGIRLEKQSDSINLLLVIPENGHLWGDIMILPINETNGTKELWVKFILDDENSVCKKFTYAIYEK